VQRLQAGGGLERIVTWTASAMTIVTAGTVNVSMHVSFVLDEREECWLMNDVKTKIPTVTVMETDVKDVAKTRTVTVTGS
jgi:hypothetical protein